jgi:hypothetical protein
MTLTKTVSSALIVFCVSHPCHLTSCFIQTDPDPSLASSFSVRNGYGHIPPPVFHDPDFELYCLLGDLTLCEEGAISPIRPLISITRLKNGNIGTKGNTSCIFQPNTRLNRLLPNLPSEVTHIFLSYRRNQDTTGNGAAETPRLSSYGFRRVRIERVLRLLKATGLSCWANATIDEQRLAAWPAEEGNLMNVRGVTFVDSPNPDESDTAAANLSPSESESGSGSAESTIIKSRQVLKAALMLSFAGTETSSLAHHKIRALPILLPYLFALLLE